MPVEVRNRSLPESTRGPGRRDVPWPSLTSHDRKIQAIIRIPCTNVRAAWDQTVAGNRDENQVPRTSRPGLNPQYSHHVRAVDTLVLNDHGMCLDYGH